MKNETREGNIVELVAPAGGVVSGVGYVIGATFVVATGTAAAGEVFRGMKRGAVALPKTNADVVVAGDKAFWNNTTKKTTDVSGAGLFLIGTYEQAAGAGDANLMVNLDGIAVTAV